MIEGFTVLLLARIIGIGNSAAVGMLAVAMIAYGAVCEFLVPFLIVARDPERVLEVLLPSFRIMSRPLDPLTLGLLQLLNYQKRERVAPVANDGDQTGGEGHLEQEARSRRRVRRTIGKNGSC